MTVAVGHTAPRSDGEAKVTGAADYAVDVVLPGMVHARLWRSPVRSGRVVSLDTARAERVPGVLAVVSAAQAPRHPTGAVIWDQPLFAWERIRYVGEPIAAVVGTTTAAVNEAIGKIQADIAELPAVTDPEAALAPAAPLVHPELAAYRTEDGADWPRYGNVVCEMHADPGGVDDIFAAAEHVVADEYRFCVRDRVAAALGIEPSLVRVVGHHIGGGFGAKLDTGLEPYAALLAWHVGKPVRMVNERQEDLITAPCRENAIVRIRSAVSAEGQILAREMDVIFDSGAYAGDAPLIASLPLFAAGSPYRVGRARVRCRAVYTNTAPTGAFRGVGGTYLVFAVERHMDHIAQVLGMDRRELRTRSLMRDGDKLLNGQVLTDASILSEAFRRLEDAAPWSTLGQGAGRGAGVAACVWLTNPLPGSAAVRLNEDGTLGLVTAATENGSGAVAMGLRQIAAEELGVDASNVLVTMPDTDVDGYDAGSQGSRTTRVTGRAVREAAAQVRTRVLETAAALLEANEADLELADGFASVKGDPGARISLADVASQATSAGGPVTGNSSYGTPLPGYDQACATGLLFPAFTTPTYHVHVAEVAVDPVTGNVTVLRYIVAQEVGRVINPAGVAGQIQGGVTQGLGYALWEWLGLEEGTYRQQTLEAYGLPLAVDVPRVEILTLEHPDPEGPYGAKGVGEPPIIPVAAAVGNAIADAISKSGGTGHGIDRVPVTPEAVLLALTRPPDHPAAAGAGAGRE